MIIELSTTFAEIQIGLDNQVDFALGDGVREPNKPLVITHLEPSEAEILGRALLLAGQDARTGKGAAR